MKSAISAIVNYLSAIYEDISMENVFDFISFIIFILIVYSLLTTPQS